MACTLNMSDTTVRTTHSEVGNSWVLLINLGFWGWIRLLALYLSHLKFDPWYLP